MNDRSAIESALAYVPAYLAFRRDYVPFTGAQVAVRVDNDLLLNHAVGLADTGKHTALTTGHLFRIASHSKTFTGVACMQLVVGNVTVHELLGHGSGMFRDGNDCTFWSLDRPFPDRAELLRTIREEGKVLEPNEHFKYSNGG